MRVFMKSSAHRFTAAQHLGRDISPSMAEFPPSFLGAGVRIRGTLEINGELVIAGLVRGRITALRLVITAEGCVEGDVIAREAVITGRLNGRLFAPTVLIESGAEIEGRIFHTNVTVAKGARVIGRMPWRPPNYFENPDKLPEVRT